MTRVFPKTSWAGIQRERVLPAESNTRAFVPREVGLELHGFAGLAAACAGFRDVVVLERSGPGGRNPPEMFAFCASFILSTITDFVDGQ